ncbi:hypothetical protein BHM03_00047103 [Ensete ventricosum]|nr:hypothetical protein BHM03_00047103 [Ensete ventricosum]
MSGTPWRQPSCRKVSRNTQSDRREKPRTSELHLHPTPHDPGPAERLLKISTVRPRWTPMTQPKTRGRGRGGAGAAVGEGGTEGGMVGLGLDASVVIGDVDDQQRVELDG